MALSSPAYYFRLQASWVLKNRASQTDQGLNAQQKRDVTPLLHSWSCWQANGMLPAGAAVMNWHAHSTCLKAKQNVLSW